MLSSQLRLVLVNFLIWLHIPLAIVTEVDMTMELSQYVVPLEKVTLKFVTSKMT